MTGVRDTLRWDLRLAARSLRRRPALAAVVAATLALAIGANTVVFSALRTVVLRPLEAPGLDRLVVVQGDLPGLPLRNTQLSVPEVLDLAGEPGLFEAVGGWQGRNFNLTGLGEPDRILGVATVGRFFDVFQVRPALGRLHAPEDSENGRERVVVLSHGFWTSAFGGDRGVIGRTITLNDQAWEIIGVLPEWFTYPRTGQVFVPYQITEQDRSPSGRRALAVTTLARLAPGVTTEALAGRLARAAEAMHERSGSYDPKFGHTLIGQPFSRWYAGELRPFLLVLEVAVVFLLLVACANVGNLLLVRALERGGELAVRAAMGAGSWSIVRQLLLENGLLGAAGGAAGVGLAALAVAALRGLDLPELRALGGAQLDAPVIAFSVLATFAATLLFGVLPAWRTRHPDLGSVLRQGGRGTGGRSGTRLLRAGAVAQVAISAIVLLGTGVLLRSLARLVAVDPGFEPRQVTTFRLALPSAAYPDGVRRLAAFDALAERLRAMPGVLQVGFVSDIPFGTGRNSSPFRILGTETGASGIPPHADMRFVHQDYFQTMAIPVLRGRGFEPSDAAGSEPVVVIDERLAREYFPGQDPIGRQINQGPTGTIIGVVGSIKHGALSEENKATVYWSYRQMSWVPGLVAAVRTTGPALTLGQLQAAVAEIDPRLPVYDVRAMTDRVNGSLGPRRLGTTVLAGFGVAALFLALLGVYGLQSYTTGRRTRELGIRLALGATPRQVVGGVTGAGLGLGAVGLAIGLAVWMPGGRLLRSMMYGVGPTDPLTTAAGVALLLAGLAAAAWIPARRAARVDPMVALRQD